MVPIATEWSPGVYSRLGGSPGGRCDRGGLEAVQDPGDLAETGCMDDITQNVRAFYEEYSYPSGPPVMRVGFDARLALSYGKLPRSLSPGGDPAIHVLDAGCGRGRGLLAAAAVQPDVRFVGVDVNRVGLREVEEEAVARGLDNLRVQACDLLTLDGLDIPPGGFDVIQCSGVIHHLSDPAAGLKRLGEALAPHGVLSLMVYSKRGREHIAPIARAIEHLCSPSDTLKQRLAVGRELARAMVQKHGDAMWVRACEVDDVEFVDRYLHPQETSYDVEALWNLMQSAGLEFLRWASPEDWDVTSDLGSGVLRTRAGQLKTKERFCLMQELRRGGRLQLFLCRPGNSPRPALDPNEIGAATLAVHPEGTFDLTTRSVWGSTRIESITWNPGEGESFSLPAGPLAQAAMILRDQNLPFVGEDLVVALVQEGCSRNESAASLLHLLERGVLYRPHAVERELLMEPRAQQPSTLAG